MKNKTMKQGSALGFLAVLLGAFGAHMIQSTLSERHFEIYELAVQYQFIHALLLVALSSIQIKNQWIARGAQFIFFGVLIFSGSLYLLVLTGLKKWGMITPFGGMSLLVGWGCLFIGTFSFKDKGD